MPAIPTPPEEASAVWKPVMFRAVVATAFGALSVFWQDPSEAVVAYLFAAFLVLSAKSVWDFAVARIVPFAVRGLLGGAAIAGAFSAVFLLVFASTTAAVIAGGLGLAVAGLLELTTYFRHRGDLVPVREFLLTGAVSLVTGVLLLAWPGLDQHGVLGIAGGGSIIVAVFLLIAAFGYRHDAREGATER
ncbi:MAG: DUF308 domain-containing protein [Arthrobacter sp.]|uniref:DUF308 domain-containing protein n=1 Tax=unclassified Arthrobacter TaxID=235627 RepID=UPI00265310F9|nr:DUF308 domain-containing protein [Micrococcaceae bacterium]MDN5813040.1 DUF308 domain-containing protein [Micrococcaceae bacterium]MDN5824390.1 DUF308 domain-containing protein [Micrococcaceae bacterium]MDN5878925.1 DUF308 domain-containing protein [Micrococcaceae bacterium]MDN5886344.1 DUF308 domain-containing protein [Micrococcaceae bacterium]